MNINLQDHRARLAELTLLITMSEDIKYIFKGVDDEHGLKESEIYKERYAERLADFIRTTMENAKVIGDILIS